MSDLYIHEKLRNIINERINLIETQIIEGSIEDFSAFKELRARREELATVNQELNALLKKVEHE